MRIRFAPLLALFCLLLTGCVDRIDLSLRGALNVVVVDGTITNLAEPQIIRLSRSYSDPVTGLTGSQLLTKATVEVMVDSGQVVAGYEVSDGTYQLPSDFRGQIGHAYQLRFTLPDGTRYQSTQQVMPAAPPISTVAARFNPTSLADAPLSSRYTAAHDFYLDVQDPADQVNYYRWDWKLWEKQDWCRTCIQGQYSINNVLVQYPANGPPIFTTGDALFEACFYPPPRQNNGPNYPYWFYDYPCRTQCWAIFYSYELNVFSDAYSNGGLIANRKVAQIPFYQRNPCLVEIRQAGLTVSAYRFYKQLQDQTQNNGGIADTPPTISAGNVQNVANRREPVVGVFTASAVTTVRHWLDRRDAIGAAPGLFVTFNGREPNMEPVPPMGTPVLQINNTTTQRRPYTAVCTSSGGQTPVKPDGWQD